eukprot:gene4825-5073_t
MQQQQQQHPNNMLATQQTAQLLAGLVTSEVLPLLRSDLASSLGPWLAESSAALKRLDTRLAVVEGSVAGLEVSQGKGLMRLSSSFNSTLGDAQAGLQAQVLSALAGPARSAVLAEEQWEALGRRLARLERLLRTEGLRLLRGGRDATRGTGSYAAAGPDFAAAEAQLQAAVACFSAAVESEQQDTRALGNLGNALLAQGELKKALLDELQLSVAQGGLGLGSGAAQSLELAEARLSWLTENDKEIFRRVLEIDGWSSRALVNWGKAMVGRAELAAEQTAAVKLYNAAIDKFEAVLEEDPGMVVARYRCALAMLGLAAVLGTQTAGSDMSSGGSGVDKASAAGEGPGSQRKLLTLLSDAAAYLSDVVAMGAGGDAGLGEAAGAALRQVQQRIELVKLGT